MVSKLKTFIWRRCSKTFFGLEDKKLDRLSLDNRVSLVRVQEPTVEGIATFQAPALLANNILG
jgi:hypothetical protein